ncbi:hypothetical protein Tco_0553286 [Tanacetum coccineum]
MCGIISEIILVVGPDGIKRATCTKCKKVMLYEHGTSNIQRHIDLHVPLDEIRIDKTLRFVKEPLEILDREVKSLKRSRIPIVKVRLNSKRGPEFTWEREDYMKVKYPQLFVENTSEPSV